MVKIEVEVKVFGRPRLVTGDGVAGKNMAISISKSTSFKIQRTPLASKTASFD